MAGRAIRLDKVKRPAGVFALEMHVVEEGSDGTWLWYPIGSRWRAPHDSGTMPFDAVLLLAVDPPSVTWWVDDPDDRRIEIDVCLPPIPTAAGWSFIDLELDAIRHELSGLIEVQDHDEFVEACRRGWIAPDEAEFALERAEALEQALVERREPWGNRGWQVLADIRSAG